MASDYGMLGFVSQLSHQEQWKMPGGEHKKNVQNTEEIKKRWGTSRLIFGWKPVNREVSELLDIRTKAACPWKAFVSAAYLDFRGCMGKGGQKLSLMKSLKW